jgi:pimeloyl-ACP methyl ester carboxylesterase
MGLTRHRTWLAVPLAVVGIALVVVLAWWWASLDRSAAAFVDRSGSQFTLGGAPFRFVGVNVYNAAGDPSIYSCGPWMENPDVELQQWFHRIKVETGATVVRFWAFQAYTAGGTDWRALDRVMTVARKEGLKVLPVLENQWDACTEGGVKDASWYGAAYQRKYGYPLSFRDYVRKVVERYREHPAVFAWMLMNEAESATSDGRESVDSLYGFARDMSAFVSALDTNHLVTLGVSGGPNKPGASGGNYGALHALPTIDFLSYHDYGLEDAALPGLPLDLASPLIASVFVQDKNWRWFDGGYTQLKSQAWQTLSTTVPEGAQPYQRLGLNFVSEFTGDVYVDQVRVGEQLYDFSDGTTGGWETVAPFSLENVFAPGGNGYRVLRLSVAPTHGTPLWMTLPQDVQPETPVSLRIYADGPGTMNLSDSLAAALQSSQSLDKPLLVDESGMATCEPQPGRSLESAASRAAKFDAKLSSFFAHGGDGYLVWTWNPDSSCGFDFTSGDPLNAVLARHAADLRNE